MKRIVVTGSRDWSADNKLVVYELLDLIKSKLGHFQLFVGDCPTGIDRIATDWAENQEDGFPKPWVFEADWANAGKAAGPQRNARMVATAGAGYCIGFLLEGAENKGTKHCLSVAIDHGWFEVWEVDSRHGKPTLVKRAGD